MVRASLAHALVLALTGLALRSEASIWSSVAADRVERQLLDPNPAARREAVARVGQLSPGRARRLLLRLLADPDVEVRVAAAGVATDLKLERAGELVIPWLGDPERKLRLAAVRLLSVSPSEQAVAGLGRALGDPDGELRVAAATALGASASRRAAPILLGHLDDPSVEVRAAVVEALGRLRDPGAVVPLVSRIQAPEPRVRRLVASALGAIGDPAATGGLMLALRDTDETVRLGAVTALGRLAATEATTALTSLLESEPSETVRQAVVRALGRISGPAAVEALVEALADPVVAGAAEQALVSLGAPALPTLERCLASAGPRSRSAGPRSRTEGCARVVARLRPVHGAQWIRNAWQRDAISTPTALEAFGRMGDPEGLPIALERLSDPDPVVRQAAIEATRALLDPHHPDGRAVAPIVDALERARHPGPEREALVALLGRTGSARAGPVLGALAEQAENVVLRVAAIQALGQLGPVGQDRVLLRALEDRHPGVRLAAAISLLASAPAHLAPVLLERLETKGEQDRALSAIALSGALARARDRKVAERTAWLALHSSDAERDSLFEALGRMRSADAGRLLGSLAEAAGQAADRAKVAETLASHPDQVSVLRQLARDPDAAVRANAVWALGSAGAVQDGVLLKAALNDPDPSVAANAAAALGRLGRRLRLDPSPELCVAAEARYPHVRANALAALALLGQRCHQELARRLLLSDPADIVRRAAAQLIWQVPGADRRADWDALLRCQDEDRSGEVAELCSEPPPVPSSATDPVLVYVVPAGEASPVPRAPFALVRGDGLIRIGLSDRRGAIFEHDAPRGWVSLDVPPSGLE